MKRIFLLLIVFLMAQGCTNNSTYSIEAFTDHEDGKKVYLVEVGKDNKPSAVDSTEVIEGKFSFTDSIAIPEMHYVIFENERENIPVVLEPGEIKIKVYKDSMRTSKITGTKSNDAFEKYKKEINVFYIELNKIQMEIRTSYINQDSLITNDLKDQFENMISKLTDYELTFMKTNNDSYVSSLILQRLLTQQEIEFKQAEELFNNFSELIKLTTSSINIKETLDFIKESKKESPTIGSLAPKFSGPDLNGDVIDFENINSKVIMIDFWASWCAPCREENPHLISLNSKYTTDQFQIVGVSLDRDKDSWENAINIDQLNNWIHISHIKFWNEPIAKLYNVTRMPTTFILNSDKRIIAMDAKGSDLEKIIIKQLSL